MYTRRPLPAHSLTLRAQHQETHAARTLLAPPALTAHTATYALPCAPPSPRRALPSPASRPGARAPPRSPSSAPSLGPHATLPGGRPGRSKARRREVALPQRQTVPEPPDGPHLKPAASPVPRPLGGASVLTLATARAPGGFACRGGAPDPGAKVCARLGPPGPLSRGPGRGALAPGGSPLRLAARRAGGAAPGVQGRAGCRGGGEGGESLLQAPGTRRPVPFPGPRPPVAPRGCPGRGRAELSASVSPARERKQREPLAGSARSGSRAAGGGEINNARKRKTDVSLARLPPGCAPARAPRRRRQRRCSDSSSPSSEAIVYWARNHLFIHPRGRGLPAPGGLAPCLPSPKFLRGAGKRVRTDSWRPLFALSP